MGESFSSDQSVSSHLCRVHAASTACGTPAVCRCHFRASLFGNMVLQAHFQSTRCADASIVNELGLARTGLPQPLGTPPATFCPPGVQGPPTLRAPEPQSWASLAAWGTGWQTTSGSLRTASATRWRTPFPSCRRAMKAWCSRCGPGTPVAGKLQESLPWPGGDFGAKITVLCRWVLGLGCIHGRACAGLRQGLNQQQEP